AMIIFPQALSVTLPYKDANECIIQGAGKRAYKTLAFQASVPKSSRVVKTYDMYYESAMTPTPWGELTWPFPSLQDLMRGIRYGEVIYIGSGVKMGKTELQIDLAAHFIKNHDIKVLLCSPEAIGDELWKKSLNKMVGTVFDDPKVEFDIEEYKRASKMAQEYVYHVDLYQNIEWENLRQDIVYAASIGCRAVFIDPITNLTNGMSASEANTVLSGVSQELALLAKNLNISIFVFCHLKAHDGNVSKDVRNSKYRQHKYFNLGNCPHELGGDILSSQFAGSRAMMRSCHLMLGLAGNKDPELPDHIQNRRWLCINEDRRFGNSAHIPILRDPHTTMYSEVQE
ncbi:MAG: DnaB-like helicase C-terminal domain-containing protein, partial [Bacteroidia bacterium]